MTWSFKNPSRMIDISKSRRLSDRHDKGICLYLNSPDYPSPRDFLIVAKINFWTLVFIPSSASQNIPSYSHLYFGYDSSNHKIFLIRSEIFFTLKLYWIKLRSFFIVNLAYASIRKWSWNPMEQKRKRIKLTLFNIVT